MIEIPLHSVHLKINIRNNYGITAFDYLYVNGDLEINDKNRNR